VIIEVKFKQALIQSHSFLTRWPSSVAKTISKYFLLY